MSLFIYAEAQLLGAEEHGTDLSACFNELAQLSSARVNCDSLTQLERALCQYQGTPALGVWCFVDHLGPVHSVFIERLLAVVPIPVVVNAKRWHEGALLDLLQCGRVTFVPEELSAARLPALWQLAGLRFHAAMAHSRQMSLLGAENQGLRVIARAKALLQAQGLSEQEAHQSLQRQAMQQNRTIESLASALVFPELG